MSSPAATPGAIFKWLVDVRGAWPEAQRTKDLPLVVGIRPRHAFGSPPCSR